jgi:hypothetical protein
MSMTPPVISIDAPLAKGDRVVAFFDFAGGVPLSEIDIANKLAPSGIATYRGTAVLSAYLTPTERIVLLVVEGESRPTLRQLALVVDAAAVSEIDPDDSMVASVVWAQVASASVLVHDVPAEIGGLAGQVADRGWSALVPSWVWVAAGAAAVLIAGAIVWKITR